jgi:histidyl-tRNA synthetase
METLGGQALSGIGFGLGVDRALLATIAESTLPGDSFTSDLFLVALDESAKISVLTLAADLRVAGATVEISFGDRSLKGAVKDADKSGARFLVVIGSTELESGLVTLKRMNDGTSSSVKMSELKDALGY